MSIAALIAFIIARAAPLTTTSTTCPCGQAVPYAACCGRWYQGPMHLLAPGRRLMRSRCTAYVLGLHDYLRDTWHSHTRPAALQIEPLGLRRLGLALHQCEVLDADHATVEFVALSKLDGRAHRLHEKSRSERSDGRWFYVAALA